MAVTRADTGDKTPTEEAARRWLLAEAEMEAPAQSRAERQVRRRASVSRTQKGWSADCTVEVIDDGSTSREELVADLKALVSMVQEQYPAVVEVKEKA